ncbi:MAG TPA: hypothetical protein VFJ16_08880 [Longimicrobium sp.]|nr:hypothetical protein [Longimicrobium sp.]
MIPIPFSLRRTVQDPVTYLQNVTRLDGLVGMEDDDVVLQYRVREWRWKRSGARELTESGVRETRLPLRSIRRAELRAGWFRTRVALFPADLRGFVEIPGFSGDELTLRIPRSERRGAEQLVNSIELALSSRLLGR